jgi:hypothetical protein
MTESNWTAPMPPATLVWYKGMKGYIMAGSDESRAVIRIYKAQHMPDNYDDVQADWVFVHLRVGDSVAARNRAYPESVKAEQIQAQIEAIRAYIDALASHDAYIARKIMMGGHWATENANHVFVRQEFIFSVLGLDWRKIQEENKAMLQQLRWSQGVEP